jgi:hypothetical protein
MYGEKVGQGGVDWDMIEISLPLDSSRLSLPPLPLLITKTIITMTTKITIM